MDNMDCISLEEDNDRIVPSQEKQNVGRNCGIIGDEMDFQSPVTSVIRSEQPHYSDISEDEFEFPSSQREFQEMQK